VSAEKFSGGANENEDRKIILLSLFQGGQRKKRPKNSKKDCKIVKNERKIPCMKIQGGHGPSCPLLPTSIGFCAKSMLYILCSCTNAEYASFTKQPSNAAVSATFATKFYVFLLLFQSISRYKSHKVNFTFPVNCLIRQLIIREYLLHFCNIDKEIAKHFPDLQQIPQW